MNTLVIDIGGSNIKMIVMDENKLPLTGCNTESTPQPSEVQKIVTVITNIIHSLPMNFQRASVGFPGVVQNGIVKTAPNMDASWLNLNLEKKMSSLIGTPTKVANDTDLLGYGFIQQSGVELVIVLGTGMGSSLFTDGKLVPNLELGHHPFRNNQTYEQLLGKKALARDGVKNWNLNLQTAIKLWQKIFNYDVLYLSGGLAKNISFDLPRSIQIMEYVKGLQGGISVWEN